MSVNYGREMYAGVLLEISSVLNKIYADGCTPKFLDYVKDNLSDILQRHIELQCEAYRKLCIKKEANA